MTVLNLQLILSVSFISDNESQFSHIFGFIR